MINESSYCRATANFHFSQVVALPALYQAWRKVRANRGAAGVDAISLSEFESHLTANYKSWRAVCAAARISLCRPAS